MATVAVYMSQVFINEYDTQNIKAMSWDYKDTLSSSGNGNAVIIPPGVDSVQVALMPTAGSGKIQATLDKYEDVIDDPDAVDWVDWPSGVIAIGTQDSVNPPTAVRQVNVTGTTKMNVVAHRK